MEVHHLAFRTASLDALLPFYRDVLGLVVVREQRPRSVWLRLSTGVLMLESAGAAEPAPSPDSLELVAFRVDSAGRAAVRARLTAAGIPIEAETEHTTYFRDPDGRRLAVSTHPLA